MLSAYFEIGNVSSNGAYMALAGPCLSFHKVVFNLFVFSNTFKHVFSCNKLVVVFHS